MGVPEFCLDWVFKIPASAVGFDPKPYINRQNKHTIQKKVLTDFEVLYEESDRDAAAATASLRESPT